MARARAKYEITAEDRSGRAFRSAESSLDRIAGAVVRLRGFVAAAAGATGIGALIRSATNLSRELTRVSSTLGISTGDLAALREEAGAAGVQFGQVTVAIQRMVRRISEAAQGTGEATGALRELRLDAQALARQRPEQAFIRVLEALRDVENQNERVRLAFKLFDSEGVQAVSAIIGRLDDVRERLEDTNEDLERGVERTERLRAKAEELKTWWDNVKLAVAGAIAEMLGLVDQERTVEELRSALESVSRRLELARDDLELLTQSQGANSVAANLQRLEVQRLERQYESLNVELTRALGKQKESNRVQVETVKLTDKQLEGLGMIVTALGQRAQMESALSENLREQARATNEVTIFTADLERQTRSASDAAQELGLTFQSAFENAVIEGESLRNVLAGIAKDIQRIILRRTVTEPLAGFLTSAIGGFFGGGGGGGIGGPTVPGVNAPRLQEGGIVRRPTFAMIGEAGPEAVVPLDRFRGGGRTVVIHNNQTIDARGTHPSVAERIREAMEITSDITVQRVFDAMQRS